jgi:hypothetical protein
MSNKSSVSLLHKRAQKAKRTISSESAKSAANIEETLVLPAIRVQVGSTTLAMDAHGIRGGNPPITTMVFTCHPPPSMKTLEMSLLRCFTEGRVPRYYPWKKIRDYA